MRVVTDPAEAERWLKRDGTEADFSGFFANPRNVCLAEGDGGAFFLLRAPGLYEVHVAFEQRGKDVIALSHRMLDYMRKRGATRFMAAVPVESRKVIMFTRLMGWKSHGFDDLPHGRCEIFTGE
jgi:hypothetical protein